EIEQACRNRSVHLEWEDRTHLAPPVDFTEHITLSPAQEQAVSSMLAKDMGLLVAPAGSGKTCMGLALVARRKQPALWIVHTQELADQAIARAKLVLGLEPDEIGMVGGGKRRVGDRLTVALVQTLARGIPEELLGVGQVVVDEAHHAPAQQVAAVIRQLPARFVVGLSATPYRRDKLDSVIFWHVGPVVATMDAEDLQDRLVHPTVYKVESGLRLDGDVFTMLVSKLATHGGRNESI